VPGERPASNHPAVIATVKLHHTTITMKLDVPSVAEIKRLTLDAGIFTAPSPTFPKGQ
jgi:hypothetical protein